MSINVVVPGAAGRTGRLIVAEALRSGHHVTAAVRNLTSIPAGSGPAAESRVMKIVGHASAPQVHSS